MTPTHRIQFHRAFSMIETTVATLLVSISLVASLNTMAFVLTTTSRDAEAQRANQIAQFLLAEITSRPFADPVNDTGSLGTESGDGSLRTNWDDCDDYHGWSTTTITDLDGVPLATATGWSCAVSVNFCSPTNPNALSLSATTLKRVNLSLTSPSSHTFTYSSLRCTAGTLLAAQPAGTEVLANVDILLTKSGKSLVTSTRVQNQQEPN